MAWKGELLWGLAALVPLLFAPAPALAQGKLFSCGPQCGKPGSRVLCNDSIPDEGQFVLNCDASLGSCQGERVCGTFVPPINSYPAHLTKVWVITGPLAAGQQFDLEVYQESGVAAPGAKIAPLLEGSYQIGGAPQQWTLIDLTPAGDAYKINSGAFRVCMRKQFDQSHNVCMDSDGASGANWIYVDVALDDQDPCNSGFGYPDWYQHTDFGLTGDFAIRVEMTGADRDDWNLGGVCVVGSDGGSPADGGGGGSDAGGSGSDGGGGVTSDSGISSSDAGDIVGDAGISPTGDGGGAPPLLDAGALTDSGNPPTGDAGALGPPMITSITPDRGRTDLATPIIVTGSGFVSGLSLRIGAVQANDVVVSGNTTIDAEVPPGLAAGTYDVIVRNPDQQVAILTDGFTVQLGTAEADGGMGSPVNGDGNGDGVSAPDACGCRVSSTGSPGGLVVVLALLVLARRRRSSVNPGARRA